MVKNSVKIYARLKQENQAKTVKYEIYKTEKHQTITFRIGQVGSYTNSKSHIHRLKKYFETKSSDYYMKNYRFEQVFDQQSSQTELFDTIAKPVVNSVIEGFNGTIFAYGQTGSGKTYAITGSSKDYLGRGIIPRSIEEIFDFIKKTPDKYTIYISYLEIYNEVGYDLLNPKSQISHLEELSRVVLLEDGKGESHIRNLTVQRVSSEQEAMRLLFLGDTNRTITETPMNVYSSRSHCIFTIFVNSRITNTGNIRRSKLNLVDLAGSERICKSNISGIPLNEAKYINLSLHYLEQVILALSQKKSHIPFRNSMLTYVLKDSLSGNCKTVLLATLSVHKKNIEETIATCKFAQRVAEVNMEASINTEIDPQQEIDCLKTEIESLRRQLLQQTKFKISGNLTKEEKQQWKNVINNYLSDSKEDIPLKNFDMRLIQYSFKLLKDAVKSREEQKVKLKSTETGNEELIQQYKDVIKQKEEEISTLKKLLCSNEKSQPICSTSFSLSESDGSTLNSSLEQEKENIPPHSDSFTLSPGQKIAFEVFMKDSKNTSELDYYTQAIQDMFDIAKKLTLVVEQCQSNILAVRAKYRPGSNHAISEDMDLELQNQQSRYRISLQKLHELKNKTENLTSGLENAKMKVLNRFKQWYNNISGGDTTPEDKYKTSKANDKISTLSRPNDDNPKSSILSKLKKKPLEHAVNPSIEKKEHTGRSKIPLNSAICKYQSLMRQDDSSPCDTSKSCTEEEENDVSDDCKSVSRPITPSRIPRLNTKHKTFRKKNSDLSTKAKNVLEENIKSRSKSLFDSINSEPVNLNTNSDNSSCDDTFTKTCPRKEEKEHEITDDRNGSITPPNSETNKSEDFFAKSLDNPYQSKTVAFYQQNITAPAPFTAPNDNLKELPKKSDDNASNISKNICLGEENPQSSVVDYRNYIGRARNPHRHAHHDSECPKSREKNISAWPEKNNSIDNYKTNQFKNILKGPKKPEHLKHNDYSSRSPSPKTAPSNSRKFDTVYQLIMGYDNSFHDQMASRRPYSADARKTQFYTYNKDNPKHRIGVSRSPVRSSNKDCNSHYKNYYIEDSKFSRIPESSSTENIDEQDTASSLWEEKPIFMDRKSKTPCQSLNFQNKANILGLRRRISPRRERQINETNFSGLSQRQTDYINPYTVNKNSVHRVLTAEDPRSSKNVRNSNLFSPHDSYEFRNFISTIPLTGDSDVDEEIVKFYRTKFV